MSTQSLFNDPKFLAKRLRRLATTIESTECTNYGLFVCFMLNSFVTDFDGEERVRRIAAFSGVLTDERATNALRQAFQMEEEIEERGAQPLELLISQKLLEWADDFAQVKYQAPLLALASKINRFVHAFDVDTVVDFFEEANDTNPSEDKLVISQQSTAESIQRSVAKMEVSEPKRLERKEKRRKARTLTTAV